MKTTERILFVIEMSAENRPSSVFSGQSDEEQEPEYASMPIQYACLIPVHQSPDISDWRPVRKETPTPAWHRPER